MQLSDNKRVIQRLRKSDRKAFEQVYWAFRKPVFGLALRYLRDNQLAEDAVQDVFLKLWMNRDKLDSEKSLRGFLFSTLKHHVLNMIKTRKRRILRQFEYASVNERKGETPEDVMFYSEADQIIQEGLQQLPEGKRLIFKLKSFDDYSNKEVAVKLGVSIHTVKSQFYRASRFLRKYVSAHTDRTFK